MKSLHSCLLNDKRCYLLILNIPIVLAECDDGFSGFAPRSSTSAVFVFADVTVRYKIMITII